MWKVSAVIVLLAAASFTTPQTAGLVSPGFSALVSTIYFYRGLDLTEDGQLEEALYSFRKSLELQEHDAEAPAKPAVVIHKPEPREALACSSQALRIKVGHTSETHTVKRPTDRKPRPTTDCLGIES
jgi:hypothetical protein